MSRNVRRAFLLGLLLAAACSREGRKPSQIEADTTRPAEDWLKQEPVRLLRDYVRIDTSSEKGEEAGARFLKELFDCDEIQSELVCPVPGRCNLLARLPGRTREGALLLLNHIDVAGAYAGFWKDAPPFEGLIKKGYLYGRGAYDMKSLALAQALAMREVKRRGVVPAADILFLAEADEESRQRWGSAWLLAHRPEWFRGVAEVLNEGGTNEMVLRDVRFWGIETLQAGYASVEFESGSEASLKALAGRWSRLESETVAPHPQVVAGFDMLANHLVPPLTGLLRDLDRVRRTPSELAQLPDRYGSFLQARIFWNPPYPFPPGAAGKFRSYTILSTPPGIDPVRFLAPILADAKASGVRVVRSFSSGPTIASPYPTAFTELLRRVTEARYPGIPFGPVPTFGGYTTSMLFRQKGFPIYGYSPIPMNITDSSRRHGNDERIFLRDYVNGVALYTEIVAEYADATGVGG
jgi:acetylornithine deacetylase/succinyl-diaminopimelate desuccinylase-like protein